jgi:aquaglyceroporin related protein
MLCPSEIIREPAAEMLGTMILTLIGCGANCQAVLSTNTGVASSPKGDPISMAFGCACGWSLAALMFYCTPNKGY